MRHSNGSPQGLAPAWRADSATPNAAALGHARIGRQARRGTGKAGRSGPWPQHGARPAVGNGNGPCTLLPLTPTRQEDRTTAAWMPAVALKFLWCVASGGKRGGAERRRGKTTISCFWGGAERRRAKNHKYRLFAAARSAAGQKNHKYHLFAAARSAAGK